MGEWIPERDNEHLLSKNGLLDVAVRSENGRKFTGISRINEAFIVHDKSLAGAKYKILLATREKLLSLLQDVEDVLTGYMDIEKVGNARNGRKVNAPSLNNIAKGPWRDRSDLREANRLRITP